MAGSDQNSFTVPPHSPEEQYYLNAIKQFLASQAANKLLHQGSSRNTQIDLANILLGGLDSRYNPRLDPMGNLGLNVPLKNNWEVGATVPTADEDYLKRAGLQVTKRF